MMQMYSMITIVAAAALLVIMPAFAQAQEPRDIILLNQRYNHNEDKDSILGLVFNNSSRSYDRSDIEFLVVFYDAKGGIIDTKEPYIYPDTLYPQDYTHFKISFSDDDIRDEAATYDILINDERVVQEKIID